MPSFEIIKSTLEVIYYLAAVIGIPVGIFVFLYEKRKERRNREREIYLQSYDRYIQYLMLTLDHPNLGCGEFRGDEKELKESGLSVEQATLYTILMMAMEQAYFLYKTSKFTKNNDMWALWLKYISWWTTREDFCKAWHTVKPYLDPDLTSFIEREISQNKKKKDV